MIEFAEGNLLEADAEALVNTVNTEGVMGKGIALQFKRAFPEMYESYRTACKQGELQPGRMHVYERNGLSTAGPHYIINFPTKRHWRQPSRMEDIRTGLQALVDEVSRRKIKSIAIPPLGCGHGGLMWSDVRELIMAAFEPLYDVRTIIYPPAGFPESDAMPSRTERPAMNRSRAMMLQLLQRYRVLGYELTLLEVHKLLYFLQESGEPLQLQFRKSFYGPYADNIRHVLLRFEGHFTQGMGAGESRPQTPIRLLPEAVQEAAAYLVQHPDTEADARLRRVTNLIEGYESPYGVELLATIHWLATRGPETGDLHATIKAIQSWNARKKKLMKEEHIALAWERLKQQEWI